MRMIVIKSLDSPSNSASYINFGEDLNASYLSIRPSTGRVGAQGPDKHLRRRRSWPVPQWVVYQLLGRRQAVRPTQVGRSDRRGRIWHVAPCHWCMAWAGRRCSSCRPWR